MKGTAGVQAGDTAGGTQRTLGGVTGWVMARLQGAGRRTPRMQLVERIALGPRQSLALVEADGRRFLVATSAEGGPAFLALDRGRNEAGSSRARTMARVSW